MDAAVRGDGRGRSGGSAQGNGRRTKYPELREKAQIEIEQLKHKLYLAEMKRDLLKKLDEIEERCLSK